MRLLWEELKKIWRPGVLGILVVLGALYYLLFPSFYVEYFCNGPTAQAEFDLAAEWLPRYGPTLEPEELPGLEAQLAREIETFGEEIAAIPEAREAGLTSYDSFLTFEQAYYAQAKQTDGQADMEKEQLIWHTVGSTNYYRIRTLETFLVNYRWKEENPWSQQEGFFLYTPGEQVRILELEAGERGYLPEPVQLSTVEYARYLGVWIVLSVILLLSPTLVRDRLHRTRPLQWSSRRGRNILRTQFSAGALSALALTLLNLAVYAVPFFTKGQLVFRDCSLFNWCQGTYLWFGGTYGQYLWALGTLLLVLGLTAGLLTVFLSQYSGSYVAMLLKAIPLFLAVGVLFASRLLDWPGYLTAERDLPVLPAMAALLVLALFLTVLTFRRQRRREG